MLYGLGLRELLLIVLVAIVLFGSKRIPALVGSFGSSIRAFKRNLRDDG
jgi:TatA/E family protein of Tat protein translocase